MRVAASSPSHRSSPSVPPSASPSSHPALHAFGSRHDVTARLAQLDQDPDVQAMREDMITVLNGLEKLRFLAPEWKWDNPVGDIGEYVACRLLQLERAPAQQKGFDVLNDGRRVQIKTMFKGDMPGYRGECDDFLVFQLDADGMPWVAYQGTYEEVNALSGYSKADNKRLIQLAKITDMLAVSNEDVRERTDGYNRILKARQGEITEVVAALREVLAARARMKQRAPDYSWTNPVGDYGEFLAVKLGMEKAGVGQAGYDGKLNGEKVQVKTSLHGKTVGLRKSSQDADVLLALGLTPVYAPAPADGKGPKVVVGMSAQAHYAGPMNWVLARLGALDITRDADNWDNKWQLGLSTLKRLGEVHDALHVLRGVPHLFGRVVEGLHGLLDRGRESRDEAAQAMKGLMTLTASTLEEHLFPPEVANDALLLDDLGPAAALASGVSRPRAHGR